MPGAGLVAGWMEIGVRAAHPGGVSFDQAGIFKPYVGLRPRARLEWLTQLIVSPPQMCAARILSERRQGNHGRKNDRSRYYLDLGQFDSPF